MTWPPWCKLEGCSLIWIWGVQAREPWSLKRLATWLSKTEQVLALKYQVTWLWKEWTMHLAENVGCQESAHSVAVNVKPIQCQFRKDWGIPRKDSLYNMKSLVRPRIVLNRRNNIHFVQACWRNSWCQILLGRPNAWGYAAMCSQIYCRCKQACTQSRAMSAYAKWSWLVVRRPFPINFPDCKFSRFFQRHRNDHSYIHGLKEGPYHWDEMVLVIP